MEGIEYRENKSKMKGNHNYSLLITNYSFIKIRPCSSMRAWL